MKRHYRKILAFMILFSMIFGLPGVSFAAETGESIETGESAENGESVETGETISEDEAVSEDIISKNDLVSDPNTEESTGIDTLTYKSPNHSYTFYYQILNDGTVKITGVNNKNIQNEDLVIPDSIEGRSVSTIGEEAFYNSQFNKKLILPNALKTIELAAFSGCSKLTGELVIPDTVTVIGSQAFNYCKGFTGSLTLPENLTSIGNIAFKSCKGFTGDLNIPGSIGVINYQAFADMEGLNGNLIIGSGITQIGEEAFYMSGSDGGYGNAATYSPIIKNIYLPASVTQIDEKAFDYYWHFFKDEEIRNNGEKYYCVPGSYAYEWVQNKCPEKYMEWGGTEPGPGPGPDPSHIEFINEKVKAVINGRGYGTYSFKLVSENGTALKDTTISYYFTDTAGNRVTEDFHAKSDNNGLITVSTNILANDGEAASTTKPAVKKVLSTNLVYKPDGVNNVLSRNKIEFDITVEPLSFSQEWTMGTKTSVTVGIGEGVGLEAGPLEAKVSVAEAEASSETGTTLDVRHEFESGKRNLEIGQSFDQKIGINGSIGPKADIEAGVHIEGTLAAAEAGVKLGNKVRYAQRINNYQASPSDVKKVGRFLLETEAIGRGNALMVALINAVDKNAYNKVAGGMNLTTNAGAKAGVVEVYTPGDEGAKLAEGEVFSAEYNSVYSTETSKDTSGGSSTVTKAMKKESGVDVKVLAGEAELPALGKCEAGVFKKEFVPRNYSLSVTSDGEKKLTVRELSGLGITHKPAPERNWFYAQSENMDVDQEKYDVLEYKGENLKTLCDHISPIDSFVNGNSMFILDSIFSDINEYVQKSGVDADYRREISETSKHGVEMNIGAMLELEVKGGVGYKGTEQISYTGESGVYKAYKTNEDDYYNGLAIPTAVTDVNFSDYRVNFSALVTEAATTVAQEAVAFIEKKVVPIIEEAKAAFCSVKAKVSEEFNKGWKIVIKSVKDGNLTASTESLKHTSADQLDCELVSYTISTHDDSAVAGDGMSLMAAGDHLGESAVTLGSPYDVYVTEEDGQTEVTDFSEAPLTITLEYSDAMLEAAGLTSDNEDNIEIFRYDEESCDYVSMGGNVDKAANSVTVEGITSHGQFILAVQGKNIDNGGKPRPDDEKKPGENEDEVEPGDLPEGKTAPEGIWVGGLKKSYPYTGNPIKPSIRVYKGKHRLTEGTDYTLTYRNNKNVGINACISISFKGDLSGTENMSFEIEKNPLKNVSYEDDGLVVSYKAGRKHNNIRPVLTMNGVRLKYSDKDFEYIYIDAKTRQRSGCIDVGDYIVSMGAKTTSKGYTGFIEVPFTVTDRPAMSDVTVTPSKKSLPYNGTKQIPEFTLKHNGQALNSSAYKIITVSGDDYIEPGNHTVIFKGNGTDLIGSRRFIYKITGKRSLADTGVMAALAPASLDKEGKVPYACGGAKPGVVITYRGAKLKEGRDYTLSYKNNKKAGQTATVTAKGKGNYKGSIPLTFTVSQRELSSMLLNVNDRAESTAAGDYRKNPILFTDKDYKDQKLKNGVDYTAVFTVSSGSAKPVAGDTVTVNIEAKPDGNYRGKASASFKIIEKSKDISKAKVKVNKNKAYPYTGSAIKPAPSDIGITLGGKTLTASDYDITAYYNNVNRGNNAVLIIAGKGDLGGSKAVKFKIGAASVRKNWDGPVIFRYLIYNR